MNIHLYFSVNYVSTLFLLFIISLYYFTLGHHFCYINKYQCMTLKFMIYTHQKTVGT